MTLLSESCKKAKPLAAPIAILILVFQESGSMLGFPTKKTHQRKQNYTQILMQGILILIDCLWYNSTYF
jgi:hypothetical protein